MVTCRTLAPSCALAVDLISEIRKSACTGDRIVRICPYLKPGDSCRNGHPKRRAALRLDAGVPVPGKEKSEAEKEGVKATGRVYRSRQGLRKVELAQALDPLRTTRHSPSDRTKTHETERERQQQQ